MNRYWHITLIHGLIFSFYSYTITIGTTLKTPNKVNHILNLTDPTTQQTRGDGVIVNHGPSGYQSKSMDLSHVKSFIYQLQDLDLEAIANTAFDLVVMDYSSDGCEEGEFSKDQIGSVINGSGGHKIVLAYMSIGEAEDYRFYWQNNWIPDNPSWLGPENPDWGGNYKVRFWESEWQQIILDYTDRILSRGFDGVYLDIIDGYEYWMASRSSADQDMVNFVGAIAEYARTQDPDFLIFPQNGSELAERIPSYLDNINGIGQEDIYYGYEEDGVATPSEVTAELEDYLNLYKNAGKLVLTVDYPFSEDEDVPHFDIGTLIKIDNAYSRSRANGYIPYCTVRNLSYLTINPGYEPTTRIEKPSTLVYPVTIALFPNYPNPFNHSTKLSFLINRKEWICLKILNGLGREVTTLWHGVLDAGSHEFSFMANDLPSGIYWVRLMTLKFSLTRKMVLIR